MLLILSIGQKRLSYQADFETTTDIEDCRVWLWGLIPISLNADKEDLEWDISVESFLQRCSHESAIIYFHNLAFDGYFIIDWLLKHGFKWNGGKLRKGEFSTLISKNKKFYSMRVAWKNGNITEFRDSLKKINMSVSVIAKAFDLPMSKLELDYEQYRPPYYVVSADEIDYLANDLIIPARALAEQIGEGMNRLTTGSDSMAEFKRLFSVSQFDRVFPVLDIEIDDDIRKAYRGGWTYCDPRFSGEIQGPGSTYDVNSLYPSVMYNCVLPHDLPMYFVGEPIYDPEYPLWVANITFTATIKPDHVPCIQLKKSNIFVDTEYVKVITEPETVSITNVDLEVWQQQYDIDIIAWNGGWKFKGYQGFFKEYIDKWSEIKNNSTGGKRLIAKLHLNALYGKFATNPDVTGKFPYLENGTVKLSNGLEEKRNPVYTAMGVFITAYARQITINAAQANYAAFAYADTDSIHLLTLDKPKGIEVNDILGCWKHEYDFDYAMFWRPKVYMERIMGGKDDGEYETHVAGMPRSVQSCLRFSDFESGKEFSGKLLPKHVPGGIVLVDGTFTLK